LGELGEPRKGGRKKKKNKEKFTVIVGKRRKGTPPHVKSNNHGEKWEGRLGRNGLESTCRNMLSSRGGRVFPSSLPGGKK